MRLAVAMILAGSVGLLALWLTRRTPRRFDRHASQALSFSAPAPPCPVETVTAHPDLAELDAQCDRLYLT